MTRPNLYDGKPMHSSPNHNNENLFDVEVSSAHNLIVTLEDWSLTVFYPETPPWEKEEEEDLRYGRGKPCHSMELRLLWL